MISVIITEYKKRGYLIHALRSVFNQTLSRDKYEVIVVKNEEDKEVDDYARKNGAKVIISNERWLGPKIAQGLEEAKGDIISLLEDDDMFTQDKLETIYHIFNKEKVSEIRNEVYFIDSNGNILSSSKENNNYYKYFVNKYNYNHKKYFYVLTVDSCISIKRELINDDIKNQHLIVDLYLTVSAICKSKNENVLFYGKPLTYYRIHSQNFGRPHKLEEKANLIRIHLEELEKLYNKFYNCGKEIEKTLRFRLLYSKFMYYLLEHYLIDDNKAFNNIKFSFNDRIFLFNPFNKPSLESIIKGILASSFLFLPSTVRFHLFKFIQKHSKILDKILEI